MIKFTLTALAATALLGFSTLPGSAANPAICQNHNVAEHWYVFGGAYANKQEALNEADALGEAQVTHIGNTNSPNRAKNLWLVYRGYFDTKAGTTGHVTYFKSTGISGAYAKKLCMW